METVIIAVIAILIGSWLGYSSGLSDGRDQRDLEDNSWLD